MFSVVVYFQYLFKFVLFNTRNVLQAEYSTYKQQLFTEGFVTVSECLLIFFF